MIRHKPGKQLAIQQKVLFCLTVISNGLLVALVVASEKKKQGKSHWKEQGCRFINEAPFDSDRKAMSVLYTLPETFVPEFSLIPEGDNT